MAAYLTHHLPSPTAARHLSITHLDRDGRNTKTTIIPPLSPSIPSPNPLAFPAPPTPTTPSTTTTVANRDAPPATPAPTPAPAPNPNINPNPNPNHTFTPSTLAHFLHAFHTHYGFPYEQPGAGPHATQTAHPHFDLAESKTGYTIYGSLAGLRREDVAVETDDLLFTISISGVIPRPVPEAVRGPIPGEVAPAPEEWERERERKEERRGRDDSKEKKNGEGAGGERQEKEEEVHWHVAERRAGPFCRVFHLPVGLEDMACVQASMRDGLLTVTVPKTVAEIYREEVSRRRKIEVGTGEGGK